MGSLSGGSKLRPRPRPMNGEPLLPPHPENPRIDPNPNPNLEAIFASSAVPVVGAGSSAASVDGAEEDEALGGAAALSREEVLRRRSRRSRQLLKCYQRQYWALTEELRVKHRDYYWEFGKSPLEGEGGERAKDNGVAAPAVEGSVESGGLGGVELGFRQEEKGGCGSGERRRCVFSGCKSYAMPLTRYCHPHILLDGKQTLYKACGYVIRSAQSGQIICGKPVIKATVPSLCPVHFQKAQKHVTQALKKAGLNISSSSRHAPKLHALIAEFVNQIQVKRREALSVSHENGAEKGAPVDRRKPRTPHVRSQMGLPDNIVTARLGIPKEKIFPYPSRNHSVVLSSVDKKVA